ncbi:MAG TPA: hypothetical protein VFP48_12425 [Steroidobacteraceae bacterium]|nr:hypothetical protein [Steroidobacteraceae bacterium]
MGNSLVLAGRALGALGILACFVAVAARVLGHFYLFGVEAESLLQAGTSAVVIGCFALLLGRDART